MIKRTVTSSLLLITLILGGCQHPASQVSYAPVPLQGIWVSAYDQTQLEFLPNGQFVWGLPSMEKAPMVGRAEVDSNRVTLRNSRASDVCPGVSGVYGYTRSGTTLNFTLVEDSCESRVAAMAHPWNLLR